LETEIVCPAEFVRVTFNPVPAWRVVLVSIISVPTHPVELIPIGYGEPVTLVIPISPVEADVVVEIGRAHV
jgi:hypothetical protein